MAQLIFDDLEGRGQSITNNTTTPTTANSYVTVDSGVGTGTLVFSTDAVMDGGTYGLKGTFSASLRYLYYGITSNPIVWLIFKFKITGAPSANALIATMYDSTSRMGELRLNTDRTLTVRDGTATATDATCPALTLGTEYRIAWGLDATNGDTFLNVYEGDSTTPWSSHSDTSVSTAGTETDIVLVGGIASMTMDSMMIDSVRIHSNSEWMPTPSSNVTYVKRVVIGG